jgi:hypothetical protein
MWRRRSGVLTQRAADFSRGGNILRRPPHFQFSASGSCRILRRLRTCAISMEGSNLVTTPQYLMPNCTSEHLHGRRLAVCGVVFVLRVHNLNSQNHEEALRDDEPTPYPFRRALLDDSNSDTPKQQGVCVNKGNNHSLRQSEAFLRSLHILRYWGRRPAEWLYGLLRQSTIRSEILGLPYNVSSRALSY